MTVYWVVFDAAAHWVVDRLEREGSLPAVSRLRRGGRMTAARPARPNCQTPPSLATLFTGTWASEHGVTGYSVPGAGQGIGSHVSGFSPGYPAVSPIWQTAAERDLTSAFVHVPWVFGGTNRVEPAVEGAIEAYSRRVVRHDILRLPLPAQDAVPWRIGPFTVEVTGPVDGGGVHIRTGHGQVTLTARGPWRPLALDDRHGTWLGLTGSGDDMTLVHTGVWEPRVDGSSTDLVKALEACPPFAGEGVGPLYRRGVFGPRLVDGGDGTAEDAFLASLRCVADSFGACATAVLARHSADLVVVYLPLTDDIGHEMLGWCDERSAAHRPDMADAVWDRIRQCYGWADDVLGEVIDRAGDEDTVVLGADHGMVGSTHLVHVNQALLDAGLTVLTGHDAIDSVRSRAFYHPANNGSLWAGARSASDRDEATALRQAMDVIAGITEPATGRTLLRGFQDSHGRGISRDEVTCGPLFVCFADDYQPSSVLDPGGAVVCATPKSGAHVVNTGDPRLHAIHAALGPGIPAGSDPGVLDNTAPAALVARQLGF